MNEPHNSPSPERVLKTLNAYQDSAILRGAIELGVFSAIGRGEASSEDLARRCNADARGMRILCDHLVLLEFLEKTGDKFALSPTAAAFLDQASPAYLGGIAEFLHHDMLTSSFRDVAGLVRTGSTILEEGGSTAPENPVWVEFARAMRPLMDGPAQLLVEHVNAEASQELKVLDIAAGHGIFGLTLAKHFPNLQVVALDWPNVLEVARENAERMGVIDRFSTIEGDAFQVDYGGAYDYVLLPNFLHHFDREACISVLEKVRGALREGGQSLTVEFVPNEDRVSPPGAAGFAMVMLATTPRGDAYTFAEYDSFFKSAGFARSELHELPPTTQRLIVSHTR